jgi:hypothetical protein
MRRHRTPYRNIPRTIFLVWESEVLALFGNSLQKVLVTWFHGRTIAQAVNRRLATGAARVRAKDQEMWDLWWTNCYCGTVPCQFSFHRLLHTHQSPGAGAISQLVVEVQNGFSFTPPHETIKKNYHVLLSEFAPSPKNALNVSHTTEIISVNNINCFFNVDAMILF